MTRHTETEQYLNKHGFKYDYVESVDFSQIDIKASEDNPARIDRKLDHELALNYSMAMLAGDKFPGIVLLNLEQPHDGMLYLIATGVHRLHAYGLNNITSCDAYIVTEADHERRETMIRLLNSLNGKGMTIDEIVNNILWLHEHFGRPLSQLAKDANLRPTMVTNAASEQKSRMRAFRFGYDFDRSRIAQGTAISLGAIHSDVVFELAADMVCTVPGIGTVEVREMCAAIKKARDEKSQVEVVAKYREAAEKRANTNRATQRRQRAAIVYRVMQDAKRLNNTLKRPFAELAINALEDRPNQLLIIDDLMEALKRFRAEVERYERMSHPPAPELRKRGERPGNGGDHPEARP